VYFIIKTDYRLLSANLWQEICNVKDLECVVNTAGEKLQLEIKLAGDCVMK
jgi:hypothetical protein